MTLEHKAYLDTLQESGAINMMGAPRYLQNKFSIPASEAREIFWEWTNSFGKEPK